MHSECFSNLINCKVVGLGNCIGKEFLQKAWLYSDLCSRPSLEFPSNYLFSYSTATKGPQPGALWITWSVPKSGPTSSTSASTSDSYVDTRERYTDFIVYDRENAMNINVSEVKLVDDIPLESQHNEQMLGLWKRYQKFMLGFEAYGFQVRPKILVLKKKRITPVLHEGTMFKRGRRLKRFAKIDYIVPH